MSLDKNKIRIIETLEELLEKQKSHQSKSDILLNIQEEIKKQLNEAVAYNLHNEKTMYAFKNFNTWVSEYIKNLCSIYDIKIK